VTSVCNDPRRMGTARWGIASVLGAGLAALMCLLAPAASASAPSAAAATAPLAGAARIGSAPGSQRLVLVLPLKADNAGLQRFATAVSTIGSPQYGQFEPVATLARRFGASAASRARVLAYLRRVGSTGARIDATGMFAAVSMRVSLAQRLFGTSLGRFQAAHAGRFIAPTGAARLPAALYGAATGVVGLDTRPLFGTPRVKAASPAGLKGAQAAGGGFHADNGSSAYAPATGTPSGCAAATATHGFSPNQYLTAYGYSPLQALGIRGQGERVALIEIDGFRDSDIRAFANCFGLSIPAINAYGVDIKRLLPPVGEATLDLEVLDAAAPGLKSIDVYESRSSAAEVLRSLTAPLQNRRHVPQVISASLGTCEPFLVASLGVAGIKAVEGALSVAAASGISVLASSGDAGSTACIGRNGRPLDALAVSYPASSPFVTAVGGTNVMLTPQNTIAQQIVWNDAPTFLIAAGGGVSGLFGRPSYQKGFVTRNRRIVPDVSMLADPAPGYDIYCTAKVAACLGPGVSNPWTTLGGTSASAPLFAAGVALVDQVLRSRRRQQLGSANSLLYKIARSAASGSVFSDVTANSNNLGPYIGRRVLSCCNAGVGFDYASGIGSVNLASLAFTAAALQPRIASVRVSLPRQRPLSQRHLLAEVSCSGHCFVGAYADVAVGRARPFKVRGGTYRLGRRGRRTITLRLSSGDLRRIHGGLRAHQPVYADIYGVITDSGGNVESRSRGKRLRITR